MSQFEISVVVSDLLGVPIPAEISAGRIWVVLDGHCFPGNGWTDFPASVISTIATAFNELADGSSSEAWSYFFDGPYYLYFRRVQTEPDAVYVEANTDRHGRPETVVSATVSLRDIRNAVFSAAEEARAALSEREAAQGIDLEAVSRVVESLR